MTVSRNTWFQRCSQGSGMRCQRRQGEERCCRKDGSSWRQPMRRRPALPDCTARPTGRTAQPLAACTKPLNGPCGQGALLVAQATATCRVNCGCIIVLKSTRPAHTWGEAGATQSLRKAFFCSVQPSCVHDRERDHKIVV